jgi:hypothetical protein
MMSDEELRTKVGIPLASEFESRIRTTECLYQLRLINDAIASATCLTIHIELEKPMYDQTMKLMKSWGYSVHRFHTEDVRTYGYDIIPASVERVNQ